MSTKDRIHSSLGSVLIVEDNAPDLRLLSDMLKQAGYQVRPANDGELALRSVRTKLPDLILLDVEMPGMNGIEVCTALKADPLTRDIPVIFISALGKTNLKVKAIEAGGVDYVTKPIEPAETLARINTHLTMYRMQRKLADQSKELIVEITQRTTAAKALKESEALLNATGRTAKVGGWAVNAETHEVIWTEQTYHIHEIPPGHMPGLDQAISFFHPDDREELECAIHRAFDHGEPYDLELRLTTAKGRQLWTQTICTPVVLDGKTVKLTGTIQDITQRKTAELALQVSTRALSVLSECNQALVRATTDSDLFQEVCRILVEKGRYRLAWIGIAEQDDLKSVLPVAQSGYDAGYLDTLDITWSDTERGQGPTGVSIRTGLPVAARHILTEPRFAPWRDAALERGYASSIAIPLIADERAFGTLNVYSPEPDAFAQDEEKLLMELANDVAYGVTTLRMRQEHRQAEEELEKHRLHLEELVRQRTADLRKTVNLMAGREVRMAEMKEELRRMQEEAKNKA